MVYSVSNDEDKIDEGEKPLISSMVLTHDVLLIASCFYDELLIWDLKIGKRIAFVPGENEQPVAPNEINERYPISLFPDGRRLIWGNTEDQLQVIDLITRKTLIRTARHEEISDVKVLPDGKHVLTSAYSKGLFLWDIELGIPVYTFTGHSRSVEGVAVTPDGEYAVTCSEDSTVRLWHLPTRQNVTTLHTDALLSLCAVSPDGKIVVVGSRTGGVDFMHLRKA
jgi:WD40 repeat protein